MSALNARDYLVANYDGFKEVFERLDSLLEDIPSDDHFHYLYPSSEQALGAYRYFNDMQNSVGLDENFFAKNNDIIAKNMRLFCFDQGRVFGLFGAFVNVKSYVVKDLCSSMLASLEASNVLPSMVLARPIIESSASLSLVADDLHNIFQSEAADHKTCYESLQNLNHVVSIRGKGTRVDWNEYFSKSLREGKKKSYKPNEEVVDLTASELMKGVDKLDKKVKGVRKLYEFLSEFAHPNVGLHNLYISSAKFHVLPDGIRIWDRLYDGKLPEKGMDIFHERMLEVYELVCEVVEYDIEELNRLRGNQATIKKWIKVTIRQSVKNHPFIFELNEMCPCFSGEVFRDCCGKNVRKHHKKHFGKV